MKNKIGTLLFLIISICFFYSCESENDKASKSVRKAYADWIITNHGQEYTKELERLQNREIHTALKSQITEKATAPVVGIIGGGVAGLYAGLMLQSIGVEFELFEKSTRVGGRLKTWYSEDYDENDNNKKGLYGEIGGMRLPQFSSDMLSVQHLSLALNTVLDRNDLTDQSVHWRKFYYDSPVQRLRYNNMKFPLEVQNASLNDLNFGVEAGGDIESVWITPVQPKKGAPYLPINKILEKVIGRFLKAIDVSFTDGFNTLMEYDNYSMWGYLTNSFTLGELEEYYQPEMGAKTDHLSYDVVSFLETLNAGTGMFSVSFVEMVLAQYDWNGSKNPYDPEDSSIYMLTVDKGMQRLPEACRTILNLKDGVLPTDGQVAQVQLGMLPNAEGNFGYSPPNLTPDAQAPPSVPKVKSTVPKKGNPSIKKQRVFLNHKVVKVEYDSTLYKGYGGMKVAVEKTSTSGKEMKPIEKNYPFVISTLPMGAYLNGALKTSFFDQLSFSKAKAIRELNYMPSFKAMIRFNHQFWIELGKREHKGLGVSSTDHPIRQIVYPSYGYDSEEGVLQIYTWAQDAERLGALSDEERVNECLKGIQFMYPEINIYDYFDGYYPEKTTKTWFWNEYAGGGAFALFLPGQFKYMYPDLLTPEFNGALNIAGECVSVHHGWIVGAMNSAYNSVMNILKQVGAVDKIKILEETWGKLSAPDIASN